MKAKLYLGSTILLGRRDARSDDYDVVAEFPKTFNEICEAYPHPADMAEGTGLHKDSYLGLFDRQ